MTDIQRWQASINYLYPVNDETPMHSGRMEVILYADHVEAVKAAEQRVLHDALEQGYANGKSHGLLEGWQNGNAEGYAAGVQAAREAVANADWVEAALAPIPTALAAIDALALDRPAATPTEKAEPLDWQPADLTDTSAPGEQLPQAAIDALRGAE